MYKLIETRNDLMIKYDDKFCGIIPNYLLDFFEEMTWEDARELVEDWIENIVNWPGHHKHEIWDLRSLLFDFIINKAELQLPWKYKEFKNIDEHLKISKDGIVCYDNIQLRIDTMTKYGGNRPRVSEYKTAALHRLIAIAYIPNPENKPFVHHIDTDGSNYSIDNLVWVTQEEHTKAHNLLHAQKFQEYNDYIDSLRTI